EEETEKRPVDIIGLGGDDSVAAGDVDHLFGQVIVFAGRVAGAWAHGSAYILDRPGDGSLAGIGDGHRSYRLHEVVYGIGRHDASGGQEIVLKVGARQVLVGPGDKVADGAGDRLHLAVGDQQAAGFGAPDIDRQHDWQDQCKFHRRDTALCTDKVAELAYEG